MKIKRRVLCCVLCVLMGLPNMVFAEPAKQDNNIIQNDESVVAYVNFGTDVESVGMTAAMGESPEVTVSNKMGREGWALNPKNMQKSAYIYFNVDDKIAKDIKDGSSYRVEVDYFDEGIGSLVMSYDLVDYTTLEDFHYTSDIGGPKTIAPKEIEYVEFRETNTWKTYSWFLENPAMNNRMTNGADFRIGIYGYTMGYSRGEEPPVVGAVRLIKTNTQSLVDIKATTEKTGNIFFEGEKVKFTTTFDNTLYSYQSETIGEYEANITYTVLDSQGNVYCIVNDTVNIDPVKTVTKDVTFDIDKFDEYSLIIEMRNQKDKLYGRERTVFSYSKYAGDNQNEKVGIGTAANVYDNPDGKEIANLIKAAGFGNVRVHNSYYGEVHNSYKNQYEVTNYAWYRQTFADVVKNFRKNGLDLLGYSAYYGSTNSLTMGPNDEIGSPFTDKGRANYMKFMEYLIDAYGDSCTEYEIWNEWNGRKNYSSEARDIHKDYTDLCAYMYPRMKAKNPDVMVFGMVPSNMTTDKEGYEWFEKTLAAGAADYMDGISVHIYQWYGSPLTYNKYEELTNSYELMKKYGYEDKPLWVTETGYSSNFENVNTEEMQAWYNVQTYIMFQEGDLAERIYLFSAADSLTDRTRTERESNFGMLEGGDTVKEHVDDGEVSTSAKPAFLGYANMNSLLYDGTFIKKFDFSENTKGYQFKRNESGKDLVALFSNLPQDTVTLDLGTNKVKVIDFYGNEKEIVSDNNKFTFNVSDAVMYVEGNFGRCVPVDTINVGTAASVIDSDYGEEHTVRLVNNASKDLKAKIELFDGSVIECAKEIDVPKGGTNLVVRAGNSAVRKYEPVYITIFDGDTLYFEGDIILNMCQKTVLSAESKMTSDGKWCISVSLANMTSSTENGTIAFSKPEELTFMSNEISVEPNTTETIDFVLDDKYSADDIAAQIKYVPTREGANSIYLEKTFNFEYMARPEKPITVDGDLSDWTKGWIHMNKPENFNQYVGYFTPYFGVNDLSAEVAFMYDDEYMYFAAEVTDNIFYAEKVEPVNIWSVDSIQLALALYPETFSLKSDFEEFAMCLLDGKPVLYRHMTKMDTGTPTVIDNAELAITQKDNKIYYEFKAPWKDLIPGFNGIVPGKDIYLSIAINDNDGEGRKGIMPYGSGIDSSKDYTLFKRVYIAE